LTLFRIGLLCNESDIYEEEGRYKVDGDPTEGALIVSGLKAGLDLQAERDQYPQVAIIPFESERGFMATLHQHQGQRLVFVKGAPEKLLDMCTAYGTSDRHDISRAANDFARQGLRVLALAYKEVPPEQGELSHQDLETGLIFAGLQGMIDPPRPEAIEAVAGCKEAGIRVVMITGDHAITAVAISQELKIVERRPQARKDNEIDDLSDAELFALLKEVAAVVAQQAGISEDTKKVVASRRVRSLPEPELFELIKKVTAALVKRTEPGFEGPQVLTGKDLEGMTDDELFERIERVSVYARVSPHHKFRIIQQLINHGEIVAVTGDGVNDAPALKAAHIGVAMGRTGTDVAKEASDMIIADDNFASIYRAVELGRVVFDNIRKVTFFLIPTGVAELLCLLGSVLLGIPMPFLPTQILWINMVTNGLQDVALAFEPGEKGVLTRPPRKPQAGIMSQTLIQRTVLVGLIIAVGVLYEYIHALNLGYDLERARTIAVTTMVFFQFFQAWNCRSELQSIFRMNPFGNPFLFVSVVAAFGAQLAVIYVPTLQWIFRMEPIILKEWFRIGGVAVVIIVVVEIDKLLRRHKALGFE
jgi:magnesium-transporting ATPase (P-type)